MLGADRFLILKIKMEKQKITEEMNIQKEWYSQAKKQTLETLPTFLNHLMNDYSHDYGTICHALSAGSVAAASAMNEHKNGGITGFQAGAVMWGFIQNWNYTSNKCGLRIIDYDNLLFPQYEEKFGKVISKGTWENLQKQAKLNLEEKDEFACEEVKNHWRKISEGILPFGFSIVED